MLIFRASKKPPETAADKCDAGLNRSPTPLESRAMPITTGFVATAHAERYIQQLVKHWSHKLAIAEADGLTTIPFSPQVTLILKAEANGIAMRLTAPDEATDLRFRQVFENHLDRFAFREMPLAYSWSRQSA